MSSYKFNKNYFYDFKEINDLGTLLNVYGPSHAWQKHGYENLKEALKVFFSFDNIKEALNNKEWAKVFNAREPVSPIAPPVMLFALQLMGINPLEDMTDSEVEKVFEGSWMFAFSKD